MAEIAEAKKPTPQHELGTQQLTGESVAPQTQSSASLSYAAHLRQAHEVGAGCGSSARPDLCKE
ncbi:TPA: hypothetical protein ACJ2ST_004566 [Yersinia enterocolitica]|nr:hypothetical protein [Yersinia enterocolitica]